MDIEYEASFANIDKDDMRRKLTEVGASLVRPEFLQTMLVYGLPKEDVVKNSWIRLRSDGEIHTLSLKAVVGDKISDQKEVEFTVSDMDKGALFLETMGCAKKAEQEKKREIWECDGAEVTIDEWPFLEPFVEIEAGSEEVVRTIAEKLGFNWNEAIFNSVDAQYSSKYNITIDAVNNSTPKIVFEMENPFVNRND